MKFTVGVVIENGEIARASRQSFDLAERAATECNRLSFVDGLRGAKLIVVAVDDLGNILELEKE